MPGAIVLTGRKPAATPTVPEVKAVPTPLADAHARGASVAELRAIHAKTKGRTIANMYRAEFPDSSNLAAAELEPGGIVRVEFANGSTYRYANFTPAMLEAWRQAPSAGSWFHRNVRLKTKEHPVVRERAPEVPAGVDVHTDACPPECACRMRRLEPRPEGSFQVPTLAETIARAAPVLEALAPTDRADVPIGTEQTAAPAIFPSGNPPTFGLAEALRVDPPSANQGTLSPDGRWIACPHTLMRQLAGGVCPVCPTTIGPLALDTSSASALPSAREQTHGEGHHEAQRLVTEPGPLSSSGLASRGAAVQGTPATGSPPGMEGAVATEFESQPPTTVRPPLVEQPHPSTSAPSGAAHGPAEYLKQPLRTLTRAEATELLIRLRARRMRARLATFIRGHDGSGHEGAWRVLEPDELEWNFHHDAICDHMQIMFEEWELAGLKRPEHIDAKLTQWRAEAELDRPFDPAGCERRIAQVEGMRAHWERSAEEFLETDAGVKVYGCGRGRYIQRANDLAINVGPISLKSRIVMVFAIAWMWLRCPAWEVFCSSGTPSNVDRDSIACRDLVTSAWYRDTFAITWEIRDDLDRVSKWATTAGGSREARGAGSKVTGIHADALLLDDPDDAKDVWSEASRRDIMTFWKALGNRLKDPRRPLRVIVQQNLHEEDLSTRTVADGMPRLAVPVEFDPEARHKLYTAPFGWVDPRTELGQSLHAGRFSPAYLSAERRRLGTYGFEAQYNCNPLPVGGGLIQRAWYRFFRIEDPTEDQKVDPRPRPSGCVGSGGENGTIAMHPAYIVKRKRNAPHRNELDWMTEGQRFAELMFDWVTLSVDATFGSLKDSASAVGLVVGAGQGQRRFVLDDMTEPMTFLLTVKAIIALIRKWPIKRVLIEKKANGAAVIEELTKLLAEGSVIGPDGKPAMVVVDAVEPEGGKESRAAAMLPSLEAGLWFLYEGAAWLEKYLAELTTFPRAKRDDRVDATSQLAAFYREPDVVAKWRAYGKT